MRFLFILISISLLPLCIAEESNSNLVEEFDFKNGDYSEIEDWSQLTSEQWSSIPSERIKDIPAQKLEYNKLQADQKKQLSADQISQNFDKISDLVSETSKDAAQEAIRSHYGVDVDLGEGASIKHGKLSATYGAMHKVTIDSNIYKNSKIKINKNGEIEYTPNFDPTDKEITSIPGTHNFPEDDTVTIDSSYLSMSINTETKGNAQKKPELILEGKILFDKGAFYAIPGERTQVNNIEIFPTGKTEICNIGCYNGFENEHYVLFDTDSRSLSFGGEMMVHFNPDNKYMQITEDEDDLLTMHIKNLDITIENRETEQLVPKMTVYQRSPEFKFDILNGKNQLFSKSDKQIYHSDIDGNRGSVPIGIYFAGFAPEEVLPSDSKFLFSNNNEFAIAPKDQIDYQYTPLNFDMESEKFFTISERFGLNQGETGAKLFSRGYLYQDIKLSGDISSESLAKLPQALTTVPRESLKNIKEIRFISSEDWDEKKEEYNKQIEQNINLQGLAYYNGVLEFEDGEISQGITSHEVGHLAHFEKSSYLVLQTDKNSNNPILTKARYLFASDFEQEWVEAFGQTKIDHNDQKGCIREYSCENFFENIADTIGYSQTNPSELFKFVNPKGDEYHPGYMKRIELLLTNNMIKEEDYQNVLKIAQR